MHEDEENTLIGQFRQTIWTNHHQAGEYTWHQQIISPPVMREDLAQAQLGFELPSLLRRLYFEVGMVALGQDMDCFP
jgi:hypothetical protein